MRRLLFRYALIALACSSCGGGGSEPGTAAAAAGIGGASKFVEGRDYTVLERRVFTDDTRFDRPVEAFSLLFPKGWTVKGDVKWRGIGDCRNDIVSNEVTATSADGAIHYEVMPSRTFVWADDQMMMQLLRTGAQHGGCQMNQPFDAAQYVQGFASQDLKATASNIRTDESQARRLAELDAQANATARQFGNDIQQTTTMAIGMLAWPDGTAGILHVGVSNSALRKRSLLTGGVDVTTTTSVYYCVLMRYPAARADDAAKVFGMVQSSFRQNPVWKQAKDQFLTELGNSEHQQRMEQIRLQGEQSKAYAKAQSDASDQHLRDWERQQASDDQQHRAFVQTIREVETWKDANGPVELSAGYGQAWSRGDGRYILSNSPTFDPGAVFQDRQWQEMKRDKP